MLGAEVLQRDFGVATRWLGSAAGPHGRMPCSAPRCRAPPASRRVVLVTSAAHMPRSRWCFEQNGIEVIAAPVGFLGGHNARPLNGWLPESKAFWQNGLLLNEVVGMAVYPLVYRSANE